jgi:hypothetical protein
LLNNLVFSLCKLSNSPLSLHDAVERLLPASLRDGLPAPDDTTVSQSDGRLPLTICGLRHAFSAIWRHLTVHSFLYLTRNRSVPGNVAALFGQLVWLIASNPTIKL